MRQRKSTTIKFRKKITIKTAKKFIKTMGNNKPSLNQKTNTHKQKYINTIAVNANKLNKKI